MYEALVAKVVGFVEQPGLGLVLPARYPWYRVSAAGLEGVA